MKNYSDLLNQVIVNHLHNLVDLVKGSHPQKVLAHEWVLGIEKNWSVYVLDTDGSDFIARLSFWISGLRDKFDDNPSKKEVVDLVYKTFDVSTFCYFEYGTRHDIENQIEKYAKEVDNWLGEPLLIPKLKKFRHSRDIIPIVNSAANILQKFGVNLNKDQFTISEKAKDAADIEKEFTSRLKVITKEFIETIKQTTTPSPQLGYGLSIFVDACNRLGYTDILTKKQKEELEAFEKKQKEETERVEKLRREMMRLKSLVIESFEKLRKYDPNLIEAGHYPPFSSMFTKDTKSFNPERILSDLYNVFMDILKRNQEQGEQILRKIQSFIDKASAEFPTKDILEQFNILKEGSCLRIKVVNLFNLPKKGAEIVLRCGEDEIGSGLTDIDGEITFQRVPKRTLDIYLVKKNKEKRYPVHIQSYYTKKVIWLLAL